MLCMQWQGSDIDIYQFRYVAECPITLTDSDNNAAVAGMQPLY